MKAKGKRQRAKGKGKDALRAKNNSSLLIFAFCLLPFAFIVSFVLVRDYRAAASPAQSQRQPSASETLSAAQEPGRDFSKFTHTNAVHSRLPCLLCHRRETNAPRPVRPRAGGHMPCAGCHRH